MNLYKRRQYRKAIHHDLHECKHARNMRADIASPEDLAALTEAESILRSRRHSRDEEELDLAIQQAVQCAGKVYPPRPFPRIRENVEIFAVAFAGHGLRTYFIQPFKIPTGSIQPTLYGITVQQQSLGSLDRFPVNLLTLILSGEKYTKVTAFPGRSTPASLLKKSSSCSTSKAYRTR